ncbi:MAG: serine hydrolase domain-containing protein [Gemmataceae bacterium]
MPRYVLVAVCLATLPTLARSQPSATTLVDELVQRRKIAVGDPGLTVLVVQNGKTLVRKGYGQARLRDHEPMKPETLFELASVTKTFTATAVLILYDRGQLSPDDDVRKFIPELPEYHKDAPVRVRDLLHHTSGLPDYMAFQNVPARHQKFWVNDDYAGEFARQRTKFPARLQGEKYRYNNSNYMLLGLIIERISKKSFGAFLRDEIFTPAGMADSFVYENPQSALKRPMANHCPLAIGYVPDRRGAWKEAWAAHRCATRSC